MKTSQAYWHSAHIYYYDQNQDALILDGIRPLVQRLSAANTQGFFIRHWLRGPHIRLNVRAMAEHFNRVVQPAIIEHVGHYLRAHPSVTELHPEQLLPVYERLAADEQERGAILPLYPNNSLQFLPYSQRLHVFRDPALGELFEEFYVETNTLTFDMLEHIRSGHSRLTLGMDLMLALAHTIPSDITQGFLSYRSHAEAYIIGAPNPAEMRAFFEMGYQKQAHKLTQRVHYVLQALDHNADTVPFILAWAALMRRYWKRAKDLSEAGLIDLVPQAGTPRSNDRQAPNPTLAHSAFHSMVAADSSGRAGLSQHVGFQCYRLMLNLQYLYLSRLGVRPMERFMICHYAANAVETLFNVSALERLAQQLTALRGQTA